MNKYSLAAQAYAPFLLETKVLAQRTYRRWTRRPSEDSYRAFTCLPLRPGALLDIGANRGQTVDSMRLYQRELPIHSFEPNPALARRLEDRYAADPSTTVHAFGLGSEAGSFDLYVPEYRGLRLDGLASLHRQEATTWLTSDRMYGYDPKKLGVVTITCEVRTWDSLDLIPGLVKIDVQGYETQVLQGGLGAMRRHRPVLLIENDVERRHERLLFAEDYRRAAFEGERFVPDKVGEGNTFYIPAEQMADLPQ